jgi:uncharacterized protein with PIN domain
LVFFLPKTRSQETLMPSNQKFICDDHCGRLARWLRFSGYDCAYTPAVADASLLKQGASEGRIILTRDTRIAAKAMARAIVLIDSPVPLEQLRQVVEEEGLTIEIPRIGTRCSVCNGEASPVALEQVADGVPPYVRRTQTSFRQCADCLRIYWPGTHVQNMISQLRDAGLLDNPESTDEPPNAMGL